MQHIDKLRKAGEGLLDLNVLENLEKEGDVEAIEVDKLVPFKNHPFELYEGERLQDMVQSVKNLGILTPILTRSSQDGFYEILSGHNRVNVAKILKLKTVPARILENITDELAEIIVIESNLIQRSFSDLKESEKAKVLFIRHENFKKKRWDKDLIEEIDANKELKGRSRELMGDEYDLSPSSIFRYLKIYNLNDEFKDMLDQGKITKEVAINLGHLKKEDQGKILKKIKENKYKIDAKKSKKIKELKTFDDEAIDEIFSGNPNKESEKNKILKINLNKLGLKEVELKEIQEKVIDFIKEIYKVN